MSHVRSCTGGVYGRREIRGSVGDVKGGQVGQITLGTLGRVGG